MAALDRDQLREAIERSQSTTSRSARYRVVESDADAPEAGTESETVEADLPTVTLSSIREKYTSIFKRQAAAPELTKSSQFVLLEPDEERLGDLAGPVRRISVVSESGDVVAEQG